MVLMALFSDKIVLINHHGVPLAQYPAHQVSFCGKSTDNKQFFGLVTSRLETEEEEDGRQEAGAAALLPVKVFSTSCHVFLTESVDSEEELQRRASAFQIEVNPAQDGEYPEFPKNADSLIETIERLYQKVVYEEDAYENVSPPPSSNSDSGIGFKDLLAGASGAIALPPIERPGKLLLFKKKWKKAH